MKSVRSRLSYSGAPSDEVVGSDEMLARLYRNGEEGVRDIIAALSPLQRAHLAMFCYRKSHLHRIGLAIAASCDKTILLQAFGTALGRILHAQSREYSLGLGRVPAGSKPKVTLATGPISRTFADFDAKDDGAHLSAYNPAAIYTFDPDRSERGELAEVD
jgi:hypothetical protein